MYDANDVKMDEMLHRALASQATPNAALKRRTKEAMKERMEMSKSDESFSPRRRITAVAALLILLAMSTLVYAAWQLLSPAQIAEEVGRKGLRQAFESSAAKPLYITAETAGYRITLLGLISGEGSDVLAQELGLMEPAKTYAVLATEKIGGTMPSTMDDDYLSLLFSPLLRGQKPWQVNIFTLGGGGSSTKVIDGVMYTVVECNSLEMFADRGIYLWVTRDISQQSYALAFDEQSGEISLRPEYQDINALFTLPLDPTKADPERAQAFLDELLQPMREAEERAALQGEATTPDSEQAEELVFVAKEEVQNVELKPTGR